MKMWIRCKLIGPGSELIKTRTDEQDVKPGNDQRRSHFRRCQRSIFLRIYSAPEGNPLRGEKSGRQAALKRMDYFELSPARLSE